MERLIAVVTCDVFGSSQYSAIVGVQGVCQGPKKTYIQEERGPKVTSTLMRMPPPPCACVRACGRTLSLSRAQTQGAYRLRAGGLPERTRHL